MRAVVPLALVGGVLLASAALATHSTNPCEAIVTTIVAGAEVLYYVDGQDGPTWNAEHDWIYAETNGHPGLQRGGGSPIRFGYGAGDIDWCWDVDASGELIYHSDQLVY